MERGVHWEKSWDNARTDLEIIRRGVRAAKLRIVVERGDGFSQGRFGQVLSRGAGPRPWPGCAGETPTCWPW